MRSEAPLYSFCRPVIKVFMKTYFFLRIKGQENIPLQGRYILAGNHKGYLDALCLDSCTKRVVHSMMWYTYYEKCKWFFDAIGTIPVYEKGGSSLHAAIDCLNKDQVVNIFPEGERNFTDKPLLDIKPGCAVMAIRTNSPIIPFAITGKHTPFSKDLKITFGKPFYVTDLSVEDATKVIHDTIYNLVEQSR